MGFFSRRRTHDDFSNEIQAHIALETDRLVADGMAEADARAAAHRAFGNVATVQERFYEASRWVWLEQLLQDLRYAGRSLRHSPSFTATTVLTLAVGLGLLTAAFTVFDAYVLRPFAVRDSERLHQIVWSAKDAGGPGFRSLPRIEQTSPGRQLASSCTWIIEASVDRGFDAGGRLSQSITA